MTSQRGLVLFARSPAAGKVKTRLEPLLGQERTLALYKKLLSRQLKLVTEFPAVTRSLWLDGNPSADILHDFSGEILVQSGKDIGIRMALALSHSLEQCDAAVLIGCDCPQLNADMIESAFMALEQGNDAVFIPALDGGYVLVGLQQMHASLFQGIDWGTANVMVQTRAKLLAHNLSWQEFEAVHDIDEPDDIASLLAFGDEFSDLLADVEIS